jgi:hypothetical protein
MQYPVPESRRMLVVKESSEQVVCIMGVLLAQSSTCSSRSEKDKTDLVTLNKFGVKDKLVLLLDHHDDE